MKERMKKLPKRGRWAILAFLLCCLAFGLYVTLTRGMGDHTPPEIAVPEGVLQLSAFAEEQELLQGVTARDKTDGDVTDSLVVETVSDIYDGRRVTVTYAAFDQACNVARAEREVEYVDYTPPRFTLSGPLLAREGDAFSVFDVIGARDAIDGDLSDKVKGTLVSGSVLVEEAGSYLLEFRVTNSLGDTVHLTLPAEIETANAASRQLELTEYLIYRQTGADFDPMDYLTEYSATQVETVESDVNMDQPGVYSVTYFPSNRESYGKTRLIVVVEE